MYKNTCIKLQAHRGVATLAPENTFAAYRLAAVMGYDIVELDPKYTADGHIILFHDRNLKRTAYLNGQPVASDKPVFEYTMEELRKADAGSWFDKKYSGEKIPDMAEALAFIAGQGLEIKVDNCVQSFPHEMQKKVFDIVAATPGRVGITASDMDYMRSAASALPECILHYDGPVTEEHMKQVASIAEGHELYVWLRADNEMTAWNKCPPATAELVRYAKSFGKVGLWILSEPSQMAEAVEFGVDIVETTGGITPKQ